MKPLIGTPKTLRQAVFNAFEAQGVITTDLLVTEIQSHVKDYLAQKFNIAMLRYDIYSFLFEELFKEVTK